MRAAKIVLVGGPPSPHMLQLYLALSLCHTSGSVLSSSHMISHVMLMLFLPVSDSYYCKSLKHRKFTEFVCRASGGINLASWLLFPTAAAYSSQFSLLNISPWFRCCVFFSLNHPRAAHLETDLKTTDFFFLHQLLKRHQMEANILVIMFPLGNSKDFWNMMQYSAMTFSKALSTNW